MVVERLVGVDVHIKRSRDLSVIVELQSVQFTVTSPDIIITNPRESVKASVIQNSNIHFAINDLKPQHTLGNDLIYIYDKDACFPGGNEYLYFDSEDIRASGNGIQRVEMSDLYEKFLYVDRPRKNS